ncbi:Ankyrin-1 [Cytospora mali]|uniref:Ankyrin-1 n=1 Tax=Cytospora mali TaxID=578113 RepID=A0A194V7H3_CYTMA|nr:Ankyrin-1 [Valsa mali var. pyri (nom. inval.)]
MGLPSELDIELDQSHLEICLFSDGTDKTFQQLCDKVNHSSGLDNGYIECLNTLSSLFSLERVKVPVYPDEEMASILGQAKQHPSYDSWVKAPKGVLQLRGNSPSLMSTLALALSEEAKSTTSTINFFFDSEDDRHDDEFEMLASLSYQILCLHPSWFVRVSWLYRLISETTAWRGEKLWVFFRSLLQCPHDNPIQCLISRVSDCKSNRVSSGQEVMNRILSLSESQDTTVKFITTSNKVFGEPLSSLIIDIDEDIKPLWRLDLSSFMDFRVSNIAIKRPGFDLVREDIRKSLLLQYEDGPLSGNLAGETIRLMLSFLNRSSAWTTRSMVRKQLASISPDLNELYREILERIPIQHSRWAQDCLSWVVRTFRTLHLNELAVALAIEADVVLKTNIEDHLSLDLRQDLDRTLGDLVNIENDDEVRISMSLKDYLLRESAHHRRLFESDHTGHGDPRDDHAAIAEKCLGYLSFLKSYQSPSPQSDERYGLQAYAVQYWPLHYEAAKGELPASIDSYIKDKELMLHWSDLHDIYRVHQGGLTTDGVNEAGKPMLAATELGCHRLLKRLLEDFNGNSEDLNPTLELAMRNGDEEIVDLLTGSHMVKNHNALNIAATYGHDSLIQEFITEDLTHEDERGFTPLQCACESGSVTAVEELLQAGPFAGTRNAAGLTPLHVASQFGQFGVMSRLLAENIDANTVDNTGLTALHTACKYQQIGSVRCLLSTSALPRLDLVDEQQHYTVLHFVTESGRFDILDLILKHYPESVIRELLGKKDQRDWTPLHLAARGGHTEVINRLLPLDDSLRSTGEIPLHLAAEKGHINVVRALSTLQAKEQIGRTDQNGAFPLHLAVDGEHAGVVAYLTELHGENDVTLDLFGYGDELVTPLHMASENGNVKSTQCLLEAGATPDIADSDNATPLLLACRRGFTHVATLLLDKGANPEAETRGGYSPIKVATQMGHANILELSFEKLTGKDVNDNHLLHLAAQNGHLTEVKLLLQESNHKAEVDSLDEEQRTALHLASSAGHLDVVEELLLNKANPILSNQTQPTPLEYAATEEVGRAIYKAFEKTGMDEDNDDHVEILKKLLLQTASKGHASLMEELISRVGVDAKDVEGRSLVHIAAINGHIDIVKHLSAYGNFLPDGKDDKGRTALSLTAEGGHLEILEFLISSSPVVIDLGDDRDRSPLSYAAGYGRQNVVEYILAYKTTVDADAKDQYGRPALCGNHVETVEELLKAGAVSDGSILDEQSETLSYIAAYWGYEEVVSKLITFKATSNLTDPAGWQPLHASYDHPGIIKLLLEDGAQIESKTREGDTVLHMAVGSRQDSAVKLLLEHGADPLSTNNDGLTPLHLAAGVWEDTIIRLILPEATRRILKTHMTLDEVRDNDGFSPFMIAVAHGFVEVARALNEEYTVDVTQVNKHDETLFDVALKEDHNQIIGMLVKLLVAKDPKEIRDKEEYYLATKRDNVPLARYLVQGHPELGSKRDEHGWTLPQIIEAFDPEQGVKEHTHLTLAALGNVQGPKAWSSDQKSALLDFVDKSPRSLEYVASTNDWYLEAACARADHPIHPLRDFHFEIDITSSGNTEQIVGIGFGHSSFNREAMPGWTSATWGLHGDDGGLFHAEGIPISMDENRSFGIENIVDTVGCCIDPVQGTAYFTRNGEQLDAKFDGITGRIFPMVGIHSAGTSVRVNFGRDELGNEIPFKFNTMNKGKMILRKGRGDGVK